MGTSICSGLFFDDEAGRFSGIFGQEEKTQIKGCRMTDKGPKEGHIYVVKDGQLEQIEQPRTGFGKTTIHWQDGKPVYLEISYTVR